MENPSKDSEGGERDSRKAIKKILGWLALQALGAWLRHQLDNLF